MNALQLKFQDARKAMSAALIERDAEIDLALTALVCGEHLLLVGPPGVAKSLLLDGLMEWTHGKKFTYTLHKFTSPEELLGHYSILELRDNDRYVRKTAGKLPECDFAFIDEFWNGSSAVQNTLLKATNERLFFDGEKDVPIPLIMMMTGSNRWPTPEERGETGAIFDRFLFRKSVKDIKTQAGRRRLLTEPEHKPVFSANISIPEIAEARKEVFATTVSEQAFKTCEDILQALSHGVKQPDNTVKGGGVCPAARRQKKSMLAARANAWLHGDSEVQPHHLEIMAHTLWTDPTQADETALVVAGIANPVGAKVQSLLMEADEIISATNPKEVAQAGVSLKKLSEIMKSLKECNGNGRAEKVRSHIEAESKRIRRAIAEAI